MMNRVWRAGAGSHTALAAVSPAHWRTERGCAAPQPRARRTPCGVWGRGGAMGSQQCWLRSAANLTQSTPPHHLKFGSGGRSGSLSFRSPAVTADTCQVRLRQFRGGNPRVWRQRGLDPGARHQVGQLSGLQHHQGPGVHVSLADLLVLCPSPAQKGCYCSGHYLRTHVGCRKLFLKTLFFFFF